MSYEINYVDEEKKLYITEHSGICSHGIALSLDKEELLDLLNRMVEELNE